MTPVKSIQGEANVIDNSTILNYNIRGLVTWTRKKFIPMTSIHPLKLCLVGKQNKIALHRLPSSRN